MTKAHKLDCESVSDEFRFTIYSENEEEAVELAQKHMLEAQGRISRTKNFRKNIYKSSNNRPKSV